MMKLHGRHNVAAYFVFRNVLNRLVAKVSWAQDIADQL